MGHLDPEPRPGRELVCRTAPFRELRRGRQEEGAAALTQPAQTTLRSEIGKIDLDRTFEERMNINAALLFELDKASEAWGIKVLRYEIKNITPPHDVLAAMEGHVLAQAMVTGLYTLNPDVQT